MLADRFYAYIHDSEQKKIKNLQPMKKLVLKQTARHSEQGGLGNRCNIIYSFSLFYGLLSGLGSLLRMFCCLCFTSAVTNKLYYTGDEPVVSKRKHSKKKTED